MSWHTFGQCHLTLFQKISKASLGVQIFLGWFPTGTFSGSHLVSESEGIYKQKCGLFPGPAARAWEHFQALLAHEYLGPIPPVQLVLSCSDTKQWRDFHLHLFSGPQGKGKGGCCNKGKKIYIYIYIHMSGIYRSHGQNHHLSRAERVQEPSWQREKQKVREEKKS